jgi:hypothetical protein
MTAEELREQFHRKIAASQGRRYEPSETMGKNMVSNSLEESHENDVQAGTSAVGVAEAEDEVEEYGCCPRCGSGLYHRSHRRWYERLVGRPRMARCEKCHNRFPYPN